MVLDERQILAQGSYPELLAKGIDMCIENERQSCEEGEPPAGSAIGTQFTCFTSTKVQILTQLCACQQWNLQEGLRLMPQQMPHPELRTQHTLSHADVAAYRARTKTAMSKKRPYSSSSSMLPVTLYLLC